MRQGTDYSKISYYKDRDKFIAKVKNKVYSNSNILNLLKNFIKIPTKEQAEKIVLDASRDDVEKAINVIPQIFKQTDKESFNFKSISKHLLLASLLVLGSPEVKAWDTSPDKIFMQSKGIENVYTLVRKRSESKEKAASRLETILSKLSLEEKKSVKLYLEKEKYDLEMISENDVKKEFKDNENIFNYFSKMYEVKSLFNKNMEGVSEGLGIASSSPSEYFIELVKDSLENVSDN
jgi:hypothetical protein